MKPLRGLLCERCGQIVFPARALCPRCGGERWLERPLTGGVAEQATRHRGVAITSVRTDLGPVVLARGHAAPGTRVELHAEDGVPVVSV